MKQKLILFLLLSLMISGLFAQTYEQCDFFIRSSFDSECLLTIYKDPYHGHGDYEHDESECLIACAGSTVTYYAENIPTGFTCEWEIAGTDDFNVVSSNNSVVVHWPDEIMTGSVLLTATGPNNTVCLKEVCVELIEKPVAIIASNPLHTGVDVDGHQYIDVCHGQEIQFYSNSTASAEAPIVGYMWEDGINTWSTEDFTFTADYNTYGSETKVVLRVVNECGCEDIAVYFVRISKFPTLKVDCYGTVCEGMEVTYTADMHQCDQYMWSIEGGDIIAGQLTPSITVQWIDVDDGYGYLALDGQHCEEESCPFITYLPVPVIADEVEIAGPEIVCVDDFVYYELPLWASTEYTWGINPTTGTNLLFSGHPHQAVVHFTQPGTYTLKAVYENEFLGCSGITPIKTIIVQKPLRILSEIEACVGEPVDFETDMGASEIFDWTILDGGMNVIHTVSANHITYSFLTDGSYTIIAESPNYCKPAQTSIIVHPLPEIPTPDVSNWITEVCPNAGYLFTAEPNNEQYYLHWEAACGTPTEFDGPEFNVTLGDPICDIELMHVDKITGCISDPYVHSLTEFQPEVITWGTYEVCANETMNFSIPTEDGVLYEWRIIQSNMASIIDGQYSGNITIQANATAGLFDLELKRIYCDTEITELIPIEITPYLIPEIDLPKNICQYETLDLEAGNLSTLVGTWTWEVEGSVYSFYGTAAGAIYSHTFNNAGTIPISLSFTADGCSESYQSVEALTVNPAPNVSLSYTFLTPTLLELNATVQDVSLGNYTYDWSVPASGAVVQVSNPTATNYFVTVVNTWTNCETTDEVILPSLPSGCTMPEGSITYTLDCNTAIFNRLGYSTNANIDWGFTQNSSTPTYTTSGTYDEVCTAVFENAGYYLVKAHEVYNNCDHYAEIEIVVPLIPEILVNYSCSGSDMIELELIDNSDFMTTVTVDQVRWYVDNLLSTSSPIVTSGLHTIRLEVDYTYDGTQYFCDIETDVNYVRGNADFNVSTGPYCENSPVQFTDNSTNAVAWEWDFGGYAFNMSQNPKQAFVNFGMPIVTLQIQDNIGCLDSESSQILVNPNNLLGELEREQGPYCSGTSWPLTFNAPLLPSSGVTYTWFETGGVTTTNTNSFLETGSYYVTLSDNNGCIEQSNFVNICFENTPFAYISGNDNYCEYDNIRLFGQTGPYDYLWEGLGASNYTTPNINLNSGILSPGLYQTTLTVTNNMCSSSTARDVIIHPSPAAPTIEYGANTCLHNPPVQLQSTVGQLLYWSTGQYASSTNTYNAGYHSAYYIDPATGCKSDYAYENIIKPPDFNELLTGCYEFCKNDLPKEILGPWGTYSYWEWLRMPSTVVDHNSGLINNLVIDDFGTYNLTVDYPTGCSTTSDDLIITQKEFCDSCEIQIDNKIPKCTVKDCELLISIPIAITNLSTTSPAVLTAISSPNITVLSPNGLPLTIAAGGSLVVNLGFFLENFEPHNINLEMIFVQNGFTCIRHWTIDLNDVIDECVGVECAAEYIQSHLNSDLSSTSMSYFDFLIQIHTDMTNVQVYSDEVQVINHNYDTGNGKITGLFSITPLHLQQMIDNHEQICFTIYACYHDVICKSIVCFEASELSGSKSLLLENNDEPLQPILESTFTSNFSLHPNPANDVVNISGSQLKKYIIMDITGKMMKTGTKSTVSVSDLQPGTYIVKLIDDFEKVQYLKFVKQ